MALPLLKYPPASQNNRVASFELPSDEQARVYSIQYVLSASEMDSLIEAAYLQVYHEQQNLSACRQPFLESQLRIGQITVKEFIRGLATSEAFRRLNYEVNNNYRFTELCIQRLLGRPVYNEREKLAWSIVLATKGLRGFIAELLDSEEYMDSFGDYTVPYQRRRILSQRSVGALTFAHTARYGTDYRDKLPSPSRYTLYRASELSGQKFRIDMGPEEKRLLFLAALTFIAAALWLVLELPLSDSPMIALLYSGLDFLDSQESLGFLDPLLDFLDTVLSFIVRHI
ncbi:Phycobilisome rod-core linker polypeptide CpcG [Acaryochloris thomasi RCC1774]|uniref:Phycobilisome rod-core linker polypeptide CpcG n=1 Tax=Acaryochloris thomasi RCC1774 TaxID=1764569 RepID=A0A2W1JDD6_9CYAN|nr:phycobilisome rod-core linker polypeptide [Acaryochloris thomasi]PZD71920.1 Phycobilisome rod-core linker polypeptide CpcG [Acaryochloris thomasi RCC1774]